MKNNSDEIILLAIDPSLASTGYACINRQGILQVGRIKSKEKNKIKRLVALQKEMKQLLSILKPTHVIYEGYSKRIINPNTSLGLAEGGGVFKAEMYKQGVKELLIVPPKTLKLWVTGSGNADKPKMAQAALTRWEFKAKCNDEVDAYCLLQFGRAAYRLVRSRSRDLFKKCELITVNEI